MRHVTIVNETRDQVLADRAGVANNPITRLKGLMGRARLEDGHGLVIEPVNAIHTHFMRFPIDVLHVDRGGKVVRILDSIVPWRFGPIVKGSRRVVELPAGQVRKTGTEVGDVVRLDPAA